jgi:thiosulfate dehydrogenase
MSTRTFVCRGLLSGLLVAGACAQPAPAAPDLVTRGAYVARLGDCVACHTGPRGKPLAGGLALKTPFGSLYSTNITPDPATGIGAYSFEQFDRAMRQGVAADGHNLYPAMPYPSYSRIGAEDMRALYAYLMQGVAPVVRPNRASEMSWPFTMRWGLALWNWAFLEQATFVPDASHDAAWNRGAYLAQGLGHCGSCHTPRGIGFQEKAMAQDGARGELYLSGETVDAWRAPSLRNLWTVEDTAAMLKSGQNRFGSASGSMVDVIHHSTQHFTDEDLVALATYLKALPPGEHEVPMPPLPAKPAPQVPPELFTTEGGLAYAQFCADCHRLDGQGVGRIFPPLASNPSVASPEPSTLVHIMLTGWKTAETKLAPRVYTMPAFDRLDDAEIAQVLTFVRANWGNRATPVTSSEVAALRSELKAVPDGGGFATPRLARMLREPNATELVRGARLNWQSRELLPANVANELACTSCHLNAGTVADGSPYVGVSAFFPSYAPRAGRIITLEDRINGCFVRSMNGKPLAAGSADLQAMVAYFNWLKGATTPKDQVPGRGVGKIDARIQPNLDNGAKVYADQCAVCHGADGSGLRRADGGVVYPPLWGEQSFNIGAGMARTYTAAAFVKRNMPIGFQERFPLGQGGLSDQEAVDVAAYFSHQPRPDFAAKAKDWPKDPKPADSRY